MKKILFLVASVLVIVGCSKSEDDKLTLSNNNVTLYTEDTSEITASEKSTWSSDDEFVATVASNGKITANHLGKTIITAKSDDGEAKCEVTVKARYNTYTEPVFEFGANKSVIKSKESRTILMEKEESLLFKPETSSIQGVSYLFENDKMYSIGIFVELPSSLEVTKFLIERYLVIAAGVGNIPGIMLNNLPAKATMEILIAMHPENWYVLVIYRPYDKSNTRSIIEESIMENKFKELYNSMK